MNTFRVTFVIYTKDQLAAVHFYSEILGISPVLNVPGMAEFQLSDSMKLGIMPATGIKRILEDKINAPDCNVDHLKCELYLYVDNPEVYYRKAISLGGIGISEFKLRNWGDWVAYCIDLDGNLVAFAQSIEVGDENA